MKKLIAAISVVALCSFVMIQQKKRVVFFGDSITQQGAQKGGYIQLMDSLLKARGKSNAYELIGAGIGGNKVYDLYLRMEEDVLAKNPDIVYIFVGVNDVWHKRTSGTGTDPDKFIRFYNAIIKKLRDKNIRVILCTPAAIGEKTDFTNELDGDLNRYANFVRDIAVKNNCELVDLRKAFLEYNLKNNPENKDQGILTRDKVHLNDKGNLFVAEEMLKKLN